MRAGLRAQRISLRLRIGHARSDVVDLGVRSGLALTPLLVLRLQLGQPRLRTNAAFNDVADALFKTADFERRIGQRALPQMQGVARAVVRLAQGFELALEVPQLGHARLQGVRRFGGCRLGTLFFARRVAMLEEP